MRVSGSWGDKGPSGIVVQRRAYLPNVIADRVEEDSALWGPEISRRCFVLVLIVAAIMHELREHVWVMALNDVFVYVPSSARRLPKGLEKSLETPPQVGLVVIAKLTGPGCSVFEVQLRSPRISRGPRSNGLVPVKVTEEVVAFIAEQLIVTSF